MATLLPVSNVEAACRWAFNAQVVITKAARVHCHSEPSTALLIDIERETAAPPASAAIVEAMASAFRLRKKKVMDVAPRRFANNKACPRVSL